MEVFDTLVRFATMCVFVIVIEVIWRMVFGQKSKDKIVNGLRVIETVNSEKALKKATKKGFLTLVREIEHPKAIYSKFAIAIADDGLIRVSVVPYEDDSGKGKLNLLKNWTYKHPYSAKHCFGAYLIPKDIEVGERVFIEKLIEDYVDSFFYANLGNTIGYRLESCEAIWNGSDLEIQHKSQETWNSVLLS